ncbi:dynein axonemal intermediate chain 2-like [Parasteatoda tepidariorum]|uniref:dynein axonemal intermediate chain 2-like n=1 Tax=Parasteatoda tepidariorum TaxID=114398 RepID=UPI001C71B9F5|nr:dynein axonemal intermediate chain 2-like [Parasteatoda tepidariorum]
MDISYIYTQKRKEFGKPCNFTDVGPHILAEIPSNKALQDEFYVVSSVSREVDNSTKVGIHEVNTESRQKENRGMNHTEGGWPASIDITDEDSTARFRKKIDKDKNYVNSVKAMGEFLETFIKENNSIDIYEEYFKEEGIEVSDEGSFNFSYVLRDPSKIARKVVDLSWALDATKIAGAYSISDFDTACTDSFVWDIQNNVAPFCSLTPEFQLNCVSFSPNDLNLLLAGLSNGQIGLWDIRISGHAQQMTEVHESHSQVVTGINWLETTSKMDFFSVSTDRKVLSWDARYLLKATQVVTLEPSTFKDIGENCSVTCSEYDRTVPNKCMLGTEQGTILCLNRKSEEKIENMYKTQSGPVISVERNAFFPQLFASCNPWVIQVWSEGFSEFPILNIRTGNGYFTDFAWSPLKPCLLYTINTTGDLDIWSVPVKPIQPLKRITLGKEALCSICISDIDSAIACGSLNGNINISTVPNSYKSTTPDELELTSNCITLGTFAEGKPRAQRLQQLELREYDTEEKLIEYWDPPEKAEDLRNELQDIFEKHTLELKKVHGYQEF